jgi:hypothetical protein
VHGGYGYTRDFQVEQYWRDNRLNMIHEGTHGIQGRDLLGRKVLAGDGQALRLWRNRVEAAIETARPLSELNEFASAMNSALDRLMVATENAWSGGNAQQTLANATPYLQAFGHTVIAWIWIQVAAAAVLDTHGGGTLGSDFYLGKLQAARYFFRHELPKTEAWLHVVAQRDLTALDMQDAWF